MPDPIVMKDVIKVVPGSAGGNGEHAHDDYWEPESPDKVRLTKKTIKRKLRRPEFQPVGSLANRP